MEDNIKKNIEETNDNEIIEPTKKKELPLKEKLKETEDKLLRSLAEIENQRRRFQKELKEAFDYGGFNFAKEIVSILDNLQRAKTSIKNDELLKNNKDLNKFLENLEILEKDLVSIFNKNNIKKLDSIDQKFDPNLHQAMLEIEDDTKEPGTIIQEIQAGYMFNERLLRPAYVGVTKKKSQKKEEKEEKKVVS